MKRGRVDLPVIEVEEWQPRVIEGVSLSPAERLFANRLASGQNGRLIIDELKTGVRVTATSWVGVVRFEGFEIRVIPKMAGENLGLAKLIDYVNDLGILRRIKGAHTLDSTGSSLLDLLALLFAEACESIVGNGLLSDYVEREGDLAAVRGRLLSDRQVLRRFGRVDRVECRYDEHEMDILENRILAAALSVAARRVVNENVKIKLRRLQAVFDGVCKVGNLNINEVRPLLTYHRLNENYREAHDLAWLLSEGFGMEDIYQGSSVRCFAFLLDMNRLFERFIYRWVLQLLRKNPVKVRYQVGHQSIVWNATASRPYARVIPDLLLEWRDQPGRRLAIDAKYKIYDERRLVPADVYQLFLYAYAFGKKVQDSALASSLLIYPSGNPNRPVVELHIKNILGVTGARIRVIGIHIPSALQEAKNKFDGQVSKAFRMALEHSCNQIK